MSNRTVRIKPKRHPRPTPNPAPATGRAGRVPSSFAKGRADAVGRKRRLPGSTRHDEGRHACHRQRAKPAGPESLAPEFTEGLESQGDEWAAMRTAAETETGYWKADNSARMAQAEDEPDHWEEAWLWEPGRRGFKTPLSQPLAIPLLPVPKC